MIGRQKLDLVKKESERRIKEELRNEIRRTGKIEKKTISMVTKSGDVVD